MLSWVYYVQMPQASVVIHAVPYRIISFLSFNHSKCVLDRLSRNIQDHMLLHGIMLHRCIQSCRRYVQLQSLQAQGDQVFAKNCMHMQVQLQQYQMARSR